MTEVYPTAEKSGEVDAYARTRATSIRRSIPFTCIACNENTNMLMFLVLSYHIHKNTNAYGYDHLVFEFSFRNSVRAG